MLFEAKKLDLDAAEELFQCKVSSVKPFALMLSPVYVFMKRNQKFVSMKEPLDFFTPNDLSSLERYEEFYLPKAVSAVTPFQTAARVVRGILNAERLRIPPAPFEISNEVIQVLAPVWGKEICVSAFCAAIFADEFCGHLDPGELLLGRESAVVRHDLGLLLSGLLVFTLLHLGWHDFPLLQKCRSEVYSRTIRGEEWGSPANPLEMILFDLKKMLDLNLPLSAGIPQHCSSQWAYQLAGRIKRISRTSRVLAERGDHSIAGGFSW